MRHLSSATRGEIFGARSYGDIPTVEKRMEPTAWLIYLVLIHDDPAVSMLSFRKALAHAIDLRHLGKVAHPDHTVATGGVVPRALSGHTPDIALRHDPELARRLLHDSGWGGEPFRLGIALGTAVTALVREVAKMGRESMDLEMQEVEYSAGDPDALTDVSKRV